MLSSNLIRRFLISFLLVFGVLIIPWNGWDEYYAENFRAAGNAIFGSGSGNIELEFKSHQETRGGSTLDSRIVIGNRSQIDADGNYPVRYLELDTRSLGWIPTALTIALILATPISWPRRARSLLGGLILVHAFILFSIAIYIWNESTGIFPAAPSATWKPLTEALQYTLITQIGASFSVPVLIWILVVFRSNDYAVIKDLLQGTRAPVRRA